MKLSLFLSASAAVLLAAAAPNESVSLLPLPPTQILKQPL